MSSLSLDKNAWYTIRNVATGNFLAAGDSITANTSVVTTSSISDRALWQLWDQNTQYSMTLVRTKATGSDYCMTLNQYDMRFQSPDDSITLPYCNGSAWVVSDYEKPQGLEGYYFALSYLKYITVVPDSSEAFPQQHLDYFEVGNDSLWTFSSVSAVDDEHYSTVPNDNPYNSKYTPTGTTTATRTSTEGSAPTATHSGSVPATTAGSEEPGATTPGQGHGFSTNTAKNTPTPHVTSENTKTPSSVTSGTGSSKPTSPPFNAASFPKVTTFKVLSALVTVSLGLQILSC